MPSTVIEFSMFRPTGPLGDYNSARSVGVCRRAHEGGMNRRSEHEIAAYGLRFVPRTTGEKRGPTGYPAISSSFYQDEMGGMVGRDAAIKPE